MGFFHFRSAATCIGLMLKGPDMSIYAMANPFSEGGSSCQAFGRWIFCILSVFFFFFFLTQGGFCIDIPQHNLEPRIWLVAAARSLCFQYPSWMPDKLSLGGGICTAGYCTQVAAADRKTVSYKTIRGKSAYTAGTRLWCPKVKFDPAYSNVVDSNQGHQSLMLLAIQLVANQNRPQNDCLWIILFCVVGIQDKYHWN